MRGDAGSSPSPTATGAGSRSRPMSSWKGCRAGTAGSWIRSASSPGALALPPIPIPDPTTANGRRVMEIHVDGDGFVSVAELPDRPFAGEVIRREVLARYGSRPPSRSSRGRSARPVSTRTSPRRSRRSRAGSSRDPRSRSRATPTAIPSTGCAPRAAPAAGRRAATVRPARRRSPADPGLHYSLEREIDGSIAYINNRLAPTGKPTRVFLWSGDALPPEAALARTQALAVENVNGDNAEEPGRRPTLSQVPSFLRPVGGRTQIYAPAQNENMYTNLWRGPFYGFRRVIDYFRFTDSPAAPQTDRHLLPLLFRNQSGGHQGAPRCVCLGQAAGNLSRVGERVRRARSGGSSRRRWPGVSTARWLFRGFGALGRCGCPPRSAGRISTSRRASSACATFPRGVTWRSRPRRIHLWRLSAGRPPGPISGVQCGGRVVRRNGRRPRLRLRGHMPIEAEIGGCADSISSTDPPSGSPAQEGIQYASARDNSGRRAASSGSGAGHGRDRCCLSSESSPANPAARGPRLITPHGLARRGRDRRGSLAVLFPGLDFGHPRFLAHPDELSIAYLDQVCGQRPDDRSARLLLARQELALGKWSGSGGQPASAGRERATTRSPGGRASRWWSSERAAVDALPPSDAARVARRAAALRELRRVATAPIAGCIASARGATRCDRGLATRG